METIDEPPSHPILFFSNQILLNAAPQLESLSYTELSIEIVLMLIGLLLSALYSGSEVAFFSLVNQIEQLKPEGESGGKDKKILKMLQKPRRLLATILIGNTFANIIASVTAAVMTGKIAAFYGFSEVIVYTVEIIVLTFMILILSEITPKVIAINNPLKVSRRMVGFIYAHFILFTPVSKLIAESTMSLERTLPKPNNKMTAQDLKTMAEMSEQEGSLKGDEREIIENVIEFGNITVREIMTSRVNIVAVSVTATLEDVIQLIREKGLSRMPLFENDLDNISGVIYSKDVLPYINTPMSENLINWKTIARKALFIPATKKLDDLLRDFQHEKTHIAIVVDEYGGTEGIVTLDDILEEIVGDIGDEYDDQEEKLYTKFKNGVYIFDAKIDLDDLDEILNTSISSDDDEFETLGGLVYHLTERIPNVGERMTYKNLEMTVHSVKNNRVKKLRVKPVPAEQSRTQV
ncbi:hemolysin family protein [Rhodohalobacter halophilus]|uniref:hemolysin family protein n=1 Tax=Rhodohalobacter halophilus TaxID=1812810 RepID=UPI000B082AEA|nr:hemolysin family protein [Rhodohalobacter halophilus]